MCVCVWSGFVVVVVVDVDVCESLFLLLLMCVNRCFCCKQYLWCVYHLFTFCIIFSFLALLLISSALKCFKIYW